MSRVKVGISMQYREEALKRVAEINNYYPLAVERAGGLPILIPVANNIDESLISEYIKDIDCLILSGGADIMPSFFGEQPHRTVTEVFSDRDDMEFALFRAARKRDIPILGICRGMQLINCAMGGTLIQDIPSQLKGAHGHNSEVTTLTGYHDISLKEGFLKDIFKCDEIFVNSLHHQAIGILAEGLKIAAIAKDDVIEAVESEDKMIIATQFHPEALSYRNDKYLQIFKSLFDRRK